MIRAVQRLIGSIIQLFVVGLVIVGLVATAGFAGVGPMADELALEESPFEDISSPFNGPSATDINNLTADQTAEVADEQEVERLIHEAINDEREAEGQTSLADDEGLTLVARNHSDDMATRDYVAHDSPDGVTPSDRLSMVGCQRGGENVAQSWINERVELNGETVVVTDEAELADHLVEGWMNSPGHRENLLRESYSYSGIGVIIDDDNRVYATQKFCSGSTNVE